MGNIGHLQKMINTQKTMHTFTSRLLEKHTQKVSDWTQWTVSDVIHWIKSVDNGAFSQYTQEITAGVTKENVKGSALKYVDNNCLLRWKVYDIEKRNKLLIAIRTLVESTGDNTEQSQEEGQ